MVGGVATIGLLKVSGHPGQGRGNRWGNRSVAPAAFPIEINSLGRRFGSHQPPQVTSGASPPAAPHRKVRGRFVGAQRRRMIRIVVFVGASKRWYSGGPFAISQVGFPFGRCALCVFHGRAPGSTVAKVAHCRGKTLPPAEDERVGSGTRAIRGVALRKAARADGHPLAVRRKPNPGPGARAASLLPLS